MAEQAFFIAKEFLLFHLLLLLLWPFLISLRGKVDPKIRLRVLKGIVIAILLAPFLSRLLPQETFFSPAIQIWAGTGMRDVFSDVSLAPVFSMTNMTTDSKVQSESTFLEWASVAVLATCFLFFLIALIRTARDLIKMRGIFSSGYLARDINGLKIVWTEKASEPFAVWNFFSHYVVLPLSLLSHPKLKVCVAHELQHHRSGDTRWIYLIEFFRSLFFVNPVAHFLRAEWIELQEFVCDQAVATRKGMKAKEYASSLVELAEHLQKSDRASDILVGTAGMAVAPHFLTRRIKEVIKNQKRNSYGFLTMVLLGMFSTLSITSYAWSHGVLDNRISEAQALALIEKDQSGIPLVVDQNVLKWLNLAVGTERGQLYLRATLRRMKNYEPMIREQLEAARLPLELMAVPAAESGYQNYDNGVAAGIWSFIPSTARAYGLTVNDDVDERFDPEKLTGAAVRYYTNLHQQFGDWHLALLGYIVGESNLQKAIDTAGHRDAFRLIREGHFVRAGGRVLPRTMAAIIILKHPELLEK